MRRHGQCHYLDPDRGAGDLWFVEGVKIAEIVLDFGKDDGYMILIVIGKILRC